MKSGGQVLLYQTFVNAGIGGGNLPGGWARGGNGGTALENTSGTLFLVGTHANGGDGGTSHFGGDGGHGLSMGPMRCRDRRAC